MSLYRMAVAIIALILSIAPSAAQSSGTGWSFDGNGTLTISGSEVDWDGVKALKYDASKIIFADDFSVTTIPEMAFSAFELLEEITIPNVVTKIEEGAFYDSFSLTSVTLPDDLTAIEESVFEYCIALKSVNIPTNITSIGRGAFFHCTALQSITIPSKVTSIGTGAFGDCSSLQSVEILSDGTPDNKHVIFLGDDKTSTGDYTFPIHQATLIYDPNTTWIGDDDSQNLRYYFKSFSSPTSISTPTDATSSIPQFFDLNGHPVSPSTHNGLTIKRQDGHSSLISTK